jgi:hypothetical protein
MIEQGCVTRQVSELIASRESRSMQSRDRDCKGLGGGPGNVAHVFLL